MGVNVKEKEQSMLLLSSNKYCAMSRFPRYGSFMHVRFFPCHRREGDANTASIEEGVMVAMKNLMRYRETSIVRNEGVDSAFMSIITGELLIVLRDYSAITKQKPTL